MRLQVDRGRVAGVLSDRDLGGRVGGRRAALQSKLVAEVMSDDVVSAGPETTIRQAANRLRGRSVPSSAPRSMTIDMRHETTPRTELLAEAR